MTIFKRISAVVSVFLLTILVVLFCVLFTAPGNQFIAYSATKLVDGLKITMQNGRFLYNDPFDIAYQKDGIDFDAQQLKIDLYWFGCDGLCLDNVSASVVELSLLATESDVNNTENTETDEPEELASTDKINLPININLKQLNIAKFKLNHSSADVAISQFKLAANARGSEIQVEHLTVADVNVKLKATEQAPSEPLTSLPALPAIEFSMPLDIEVSELAIANIDIIPVGQNEAQTIRQLELQLAAIDSRISLPKLSAQYQSWQLNSSLEATLAAQNPLAGEVTLTHPDHQATLTLAGDLSALQIDLQTQGVYPLTLDGVVNLKETNYPFQLTGDIKQWQFPVEQNQLTVSDLSLQLQGNADDYKLALSTVSQLAAYPAVKANVQLQGGLTQAQIEKLTLDANESQATVTAKANWQQGVDVTFSGDLQHLKAQYVTDAVNSDVSGQFVGTFKLAQDTWQLSLKDTGLQGHVNEVPFSFASNIELDSSLHARFDKLEINSGDNQIALSGQVNDTWQVDGKVILNANEQKVLPLTGSGKANLSVRGKRMEPLVNLNLMLDSLSYEDIQANTLSLKAKFDYAADWQTDIDLSLDSATLGTTVINQIELDASGDKRDHHLRFALDSEQGKAQFEVDGKLAQQVWQGTLSKVQVSDNTVTLTTDKPVDIQFNSQSLDFVVQPHCWQTPQSNLCIATLQQTKQVGQLNAQLDNLALADFKHLLPENLQVQGSASGEFLANWQNNALKTLRAKLATEQLAAILIEDGQQFKLPIETLTVHAMTDAKHGELSANLGSSVLGKISTEFSVDDIQNSKTLTGQVNVDKILLDDLKPFISQLEQFKGDITGKLAVSGTLLDPLLDGQIAVNDISLDGSALPVALQNSQLNITFDKTKANLQGELNDLEGGMLAVTGGVDWQGDTPAVDVNIDGKTFYVRAQQGVVFKVSPELDISLHDNAFNLVGKVVVPYGRIEIEELPEGAVQVSDDEVIVDIEQQQSEQVPFDYNIDLSLIVENDVRVDSFGLESKIAGDLSIKMDQDTPMIATGELNLVEGSYRAFGQDLQIRTGQVGFSGPIDKPYLNIKAIRNPENTANNVVAGITLTGNVEQPSLKVFSEPAMDQAQALAYLLNGQPLDEGDSSTDAMLTQLLLAQGMSRSEGVVSKVGETFGLSDVSLSSKGSGDDTKVEISGYVSPGIQVKYSVGIFDSLSEVAVRYQLLSQLYVEITNGIDQSADILYKFDWDE